MTDIIIIAVVAAVVGLAARYIYKKKKSGAACIGCPDGGSTCGGSCSGCSANE